MFHYSSYWRTWSRVLKPFGEVYDNPEQEVIIPASKCVEISLTPINGWSSKAGVDDLKTERIRVHFTQRSNTDKLVHALPLEVITQLHRNLGPALAARLLTFDYMSHIWWELQQKHSNGGTPFEMCKKK